MFNVYIDDSGTDPKQRIAVGSALVIPAKRAPALEREWEGFKAKYKITDLHTSECVSRNPKSQYSSWDDECVSAALARTRQITKKYAVKALSFAVTKSDFDQVMPDVWKRFVGENYYVWAIWHLLVIIRNWSQTFNTEFRFEFVFDHEKGKGRDDVEQALALMELAHPGIFTGHYSFRKRRECGALQCADLLAWASYNKARFRYENTPINPFAEETVKEFMRFRQKEQWMWAKSLPKKELIRAVDLNLKPHIDSFAKSQ